jgi:Xaa-Pro aminopeptidase
LNEEMTLLAVAEYPGPRPSERPAGLAALLAGLPSVDVRPRLGLLRERLDAEGLGALVVSGRSNVRYLSGFTGSAGTLVVGPDEAWLVTDGRYGEQAETQLGESGVRQLLRAGCNDLGGTLMDENISRAAGAAHGQRMDEASFRRIVEPLGRPLAQRTTLYTPASRAA